MLSIGGVLSSEPRRDIARVTRTFCGVHAAFTISGRTHAHGRSAFVANGHQCVWCDSEQQLCNRSHAKHLLCGDHACSGTTQAVTVSFCLRCAMQTFDNFRSGIWKHSAKSMSTWRVFMKTVSCWKTVSLFKFHIMRVLPLSFYFLRPDAENGGDSCVIRSSPAMHWWGWPTLSIVYTILPPIYFARCACSHLR